jgi:site-specific recombinase XerD
VESLGSFDQLTRSWSRHLRAENKSARTLETYGEGVTQFVGHVARAGITSVGDVESAHIEEFIGDLLATRSPATANNRFRALEQLGSCEPRRTSQTIRWNVCVPAGPGEACAGARDRRSEGALLKTCETRTFVDRRDEAIIRLLADTGIRRGERVGLTVADVDADHGEVAVLGKGRRPRVVPFGSRTAKALDRYEVLRAHHPCAGLDAYFLSRRGSLGASGVSIMLRRRAREAGLSHVFAHQFRHSFAHHWRTWGNELVKARRHSMNDSCRTHEVLPDGDQLLPYRRPVPLWQRVNAGSDSVHMLDVRAGHPLEPGDLLVIKAVVPEGTPPRPKQS